MKKISFAGLAFWIGCLDREKRHTLFFYIYSSLNVVCKRAKQLTPFFLFLFFFFPLLCFFSLRGESVILGEKNLKI